MKPSFCQLCKKDIDLLFKEKFETYSLYECPHCLGQFWDPMKNPGADWYEKDARYSFRNKNPLKKPEINHAEFLRDLPEKGGKLLDIGMGTGNFLAASVAKGYEGYGIDFDEDGLETARRFFGLERLFPLSIEQAAEKFGPMFDVVTMFEVLEHLEDPASEIETIKGLLKDGGYLAISVPYRGSWDGFKTHDHPPRHLTRWGKESMEHFLKAHGFSIVRMKVLRVPFAFIIVKYHFWYRQFSFNAVEKFASTTKKKSGDEMEGYRKQYWKIRLLQIAARMKDYILFGIPALILYIRLIIRGKQGINLYVLAKKDLR